MLAACASSSTAVAGCYGKCRCCLVVGQHPRTFGKPDLETLMVNLNLFLLVDPRLPDLICSRCINSLCMIKRFREMVMSSESKLLRVISEEVKLEAQSTSLMTDKVGLSSQNDPLEFGQRVIKIENDNDYQSITGGEIKSPDELTGAVKTEINVIEPECISKVEIEFEVPRRDDPDKELDKNSQDPRKKIICPVPSKKNIVSADVTPSGDKRFSHMAPEPTARHKNKNVKRMPPVIVENYTNSGNKLLSVQPVRAKSNTTVITIGDIPEVATENTKLRANIIQTLQNSNILPFRSNRASFQCFYCDKNFVRFVDYRIHTALDHKEGADDYTILKWLQVRQHKMIYADISSMKCKLCDNPFERLDELVKHLSEKHQKVYYDVDSNSGKKSSHRIVGLHLANDAFTCQFCKQDFRFFRTLTNHMAEHYDFFTCEDCGKSFLTNERLFRHRRMHQKTETKCTQCDKIFKSEHAMLTHIKLIHNKKKCKYFKCLLCSVKFLYTRPMTKYEHMEKVHGVKRPVFKCDVCDKVYNTIHVLNAHRRTAHTRKNPFMCDKCGYVTMERHVMERHMDSHNGVRKYKCELCDKKLRTKNTLRLHLRGHYNDKRFACSLCDAAFIQKHCLKSHIKSRHPDSGIDVTKL